MKQIEVINLETIIDVTAETSNVEILVQDYDSELAERFALEAQESAIDAEESADIATAQASIATAQAGIATTQAGIATTQASNALTSANNAAASAASAASAALNTPLTGFTTGANSTILATDTTLQAFGKTQGQINAKENSITAGTTAQYFRGDKTFQDFETATRSTVLTGLPTLTNTAISATDTILQAFAEAQGQINARVSGTGASGQVAFWNGTSSQTGDNGLFWDNTNKRLGVGTNAPSQALDVVGNGRILNNVNFPQLIVGRTATRNSALTWDDPAGEALFQTFSRAFPFTFDASAIKFMTTGVVRARIFETSGNVLIQNGGTFTDAGFRLDVQGSTRFNGLSTIQGTTASDTAPLGSDLATTGTGTNWAGTDFATGYTHTIGSTAALTTTLAAVITTSYQITYTVTGRTTGSFVINYGGTSTAALTATGAFGPRATSNAALEIVPTTDFNGTIVLSVRTIGTSSATISFLSSNGGLTNEIRVSPINTSFFMGREAGRRNTTGISNTFVGATAGQNNTTGANGTFIGRGAGLNNSTGTGNTFVGVEAGANNITGASNSFFGLLAGTANTTGGSNSFFGSLSGTANTTGGSNSFFGTSAGAANTTAINNSFFGASAGGNNTTGGQNSFFGTNAGGLNTTGTLNSFFGHGSGLANLTGGSNSFFGHNAGTNISTGSNNTILGQNAARYTGTGTTAMTSVNNSIYLGFQTRGLNATGSTNEVVIGYDVVGLGSNTTVLGNTSTTHGRWYGSLLLGTTTNAASSILTMESTTQGFLPPRMTTTQRNAIATPATGLMIYNTTDNLVQVYNGTSWINL
jgi:hypothetical protein